MKTNQPKDHGLRGPDLLRAVADRIELEPELYLQEDWSCKVSLDFDVYADDPDEDGWERRSIVYAGQDEETCGTAHCVAGWVTTLCGQKVPHGDYQIKAIELLGCDPDAANAVFSGSWVARGAERSSPHIARSKMAAEALRGLADGESVGDVSHEDYYNEYSKDLVMWEGS